MSSNALSIITNWMTINSLNSLNRYKPQISEGSYPSLLPTGGSNKSIDEAEINGLLEEDRKPKIFIEKVPISSLPAGLLEKYLAKEVKEINGHKILNYYAGWCFDYPKGFYLEIEVDQNKP